MVQVNRAAAETFSGDAVSEIEDIFESTASELRKEKEDLHVKNIVFDPQTLRPVDLNDRSPAGVDAAIAVYMNAKSAAKRLKGIMYQTATAISNLTDKAGLKNTRFVRGDALEVKVVFPSRDFNPSQIKKIYEAADTTKLADQIVAEIQDFIEKSDVDGTYNLQLLIESFIAARRIQQKTHELLRVDTVKVNLTPLKAAEKCGDKIDRESGVIRDAILAHEQTPFFDPTITLEDGETEGVNEE